MVADHQLLRLDVATAFKLMKQLRADCHLLVSCHCMDYSLLLGVHKTSLPQDSLSPDGDFVSFNQVEGTAIISVPESEENALHAVGADGRAYDEIYYLGVIDILMTYTTKKVLETAWYNAVKGRDCNCSSQPPEHYAQRFFEFVQGRIVTPEGPLEHVRNKYLKLTGVEYVTTSSLYMFL